MDVYRQKKRRFGQLLFYLATKLTRLNVHVVELLERSLKVSVYCN